MTPSSAKAKGRKFQQWVRDLILNTFKDRLQTDDCKSTSMGAGGEDIQLSPHARKVFPFSIECKHRSSFSFYKIYDQAKANSKKSEPLVFVKANRRDALIMMDAKKFMQIYRKAYVNKEN